MFFERAARLAFGASGGGGGATRADPAPPRREAPRAKLGLALGGGAARGWAHIGVLQALSENGVEPDVIAGTSIGAVVGGCHVAGKLAAVEEFARSLTRRRVVGLLDVHIGSGLIGGERLRKLLERDFPNELIEKLPRKFTAIATEINTGHEIWLTRGRLVEAMRASYALPGIFDPVKVGGRWLMDGALVNPVPVTAARALGAEVVVSVNLAGEVFGRGTVIPAHGSAVEDEIVVAAAAEFGGGLLAPVRNAASRMNPFASRSEKRRIDGPRMATVMIEAFNITQDRIARARLAGDPPDVMISPPLGKIGLFEFHKAEEAIAAGKAAAEAALPRIREVMAAMQQQAA